MKDNHGKTRLQSDRSVNAEAPKAHRIYLKDSRQWVEVSETVYLDHRRYYDALRKRQQEHGQCCCPKNKFWLCDGDCCNCEFVKAGDKLSLDYIVSDEGGEVGSPLNILEDQTPSIESIISDHEELMQLFQRLDVLMPEARHIGELRQQGLSDEEISKEIGINRTTFLYRLRKAKAQLITEFPDQF